MFWSWIVTSTKQELIGCQIGQWRLSDGRFPVTLLNNMPERATGPQVVPLFEG